MHVFVCLFCFVFFTLTTYDLVWDNLCPLGDEKWCHGSRVCLYYHHCVPYPMALFFFDSYQSSDIPDWFFFFLYLTPFLTRLLFIFFYFLLCLSVGKLALQRWFPPMWNFIWHVKNCVIYKNCQTAHTLRFLPTEAERMSIIVLSGYTKAWIGLQTSHPASDFK